MSPVFAVPRPRRAHVATLVALLLILVPSVARAQDAGAVELEARVFEIARQLRCPTCVSESVADSNAAISIEMRRQIQTQLENGASEAEIKAFFQERYGDWILLEPPRRGIHLLVWWLPVAGLVAGAGGLTWLMVRWTRAGRRAAAEGEVPDEDLARVRAALEADEAAS